MSSSLINLYNNISVALDTHTKAMARLQEQTATGSRVNRSSDEPSTAYQILSLNSQERSFQNYIDSLSAAVSKLEFVSTVIENMTSSFAVVQSIMAAITSGLNGQDARERTAEGINDVLEEMVSFANTKHTNQYLFGGSNTTDAPYEVQRTDGKITDVTYQGSSDSRDVELAPGVKSSIFHVGNDIFQLGNRSEPEFFGDTGAKAGTGTSNVVGEVELKVIYDGSNYQISIDGGASYAVVPAGGETNQAVTDSVTGKVLYVDTTEINSAGTDVVRIAGTGDVFTTLINIRDMLCNEAGLSDAQLKELQGDSLRAIDEIANLLVQTEVSVGSKIGYLSDLKDSLTNMKYNAEDETSRLQDADIAQLAIDLSQREVLYQMSLSVAARLMSLSLLDFLD
ncbi:MAG: flagellar hook-associated protein FlgL [Planctomycetes bacterium]|nr:flagellar hook-associated protein FlgL [Planctomycetota bacterium]